MSAADGHYPELHSSIEQLGPEHADETCVHVIEPVCGGEASSGLRVLAVFDGPEGEPIFSGSGRCAAMRSGFDDYAAEVEARADDVQRGILDAYTEHFEAERRRFFDIPRQLAAAREAAHMTQRQLAKACGIHQSEISRIECGQVSPALETLTRLTAPLGVRLAVVDADGRLVSS